MTRNNLVRNKGSTTRRLEHRRLKGVEQAIIKNAARDDHLRDFRSTLSSFSTVDRYVKQLLKSTKNAPKCTFLI